MASSLATATATPPSTRWPAVLPEVLSAMPAEALLAPLPEFGGRYPVLGSWVVGDQAAGLCIREGRSLITTNMSHFVPHCFD